MLHSIIPTLHIFSFQYSKFKFYFFQFFHFIFFLNPTYSKIYNICSFYVPYITYFSHFLLSNDIIFWKSEQQKTFTFFLKFSFHFSLLSLCVVLLLWGKEKNYIHKHCRERKKKTHTIVCRNAIKKEKKEIFLSSPHIFYSKNFLFLNGQYIC